MKTNAIRMERTSHPAAERHDLGASRTEMSQAVSSAVLSFLLGAGSLFGAIAPFPVAAAVAFPYRFAIPAAVGSIVGCLVFSQTGRALPLMIAVLITCALRFLLEKSRPDRVKPVFLSLVTFGVMALTAVFYSMTVRLSTPDLLLLGIEAVLTATFAYFFHIAGSALFRRRATAALSYAQRVGLCVLYIAAVCSLSSFRILQVNLGVIGAVLSIYAAMYRKGVAGASMTAIAAAIALSLGSMSMLEFSGMLIIASFVAAAFSPLRKIGQLIAFLAVSVCFVFLMGAPLGLIYRLVDIFLATAAFVLLPERWLDRIYAGGERVSPSGEAGVSAASSQWSVAAQLAFASDTIRDLQDELATVSDRFRRIDYNNIGTIYDDAANTVCRGCTMALNCWDDNYNDTVNSFNPISDTLRLNGEITPPGLPTYFRDKCCKPEQLCAAVNEYYRGFVARQNAKRQVAESRRIVFEQLHSISDMLVEVSEEISDVTAYDETLTEIICQTWSKLEEDADRILCPIDRFGRVRVEIYTRRPLRISERAICMELSEASGREFDLPSISIVQGRTRISLFEKANCGIDFAAQQSCCRDNPICGDSYEYFTDARGFAYLLLSDGMGNGKRAAIDSVMTCSILIKLLKAGFGLESAIKLLNSSLLVKSADESLATVDLLRVDLYSGEAELYKAGAAATFVYSKGEIRRFSSASLPVGILEGAGCERQTCRLRSGDIVILASDGATVPSESWIGDELRKCAELPANQIAAKLMQEAKHRAEEHPDDITILVAKIQKGV